MEQKQKAIWNATRFETKIPNVVAKVSTKGFIGLYTKNPDGSEQYQCGFGPEFGTLILGHDHEAVKLADDYKNAAKQDRKIARQAANELTKQAMSNPELLAQIKQLVSKKVS